MDAGGKPGLGEQIAAALAWWREAGVDCDFADAPADWLAKVEGEAAAPRPGVAAPPTAANVAANAPAESRDPRLRGKADERPQAAIQTATLPDTLAAFHQWWLTEPSLGELARRVPPRGPASPQLMIVVADPEEEDDERLLSGAHGRLLAGILGALGIFEEQAYLASALPRRTPLPDWADLNRRGLGEILRHHIELVRPARVLVFGFNILPLLGHDPAQKQVILPAVNHDGRAFPLLAEMDLAALLARPRAKGGLWNRLLEWTGAQGQ